MNKYVSVSASMALVSLVFLCPHHRAYMQKAYAQEINKTNTTSHKVQSSTQVFDGHMDEDEDIPDKEVTADNLNEQEVQDNTKIDPKPTKGALYISVHSINNISDDDFPKVISRIKRAISSSKKENTPLKGTKLYDYIVKGMEDNHKQSSYFESALSDLNDVKSEQSTVVLDQLPAAIDCDENMNDNDLTTEAETNQPIDYCYNVDIKEKDKDGKHMVSLDVETVWQGSMNDHDLDIDDYHVLLSNAQTQWFYRGVPADADGRKRLFIFELTPVIETDDMLQSNTVPPNTSAPTTKARIPSK